MRCRILFRWTKKRETKTKTSRARAALCSSLIMYPKYKRLQWRDEWCKTIFVVSDIMCMTCSLAEGYSNNTAQTTIWLQRHRLMYWSKTSKAPHMELMEWVAFWISQKKKTKTKPKKKKKTSHTDIAETWTRCLLTFWCTGCSDIGWYHFITTDKVLLNVRIACVQDVDANWAMRCSSSHGPVVQWLTRRTMDQKFPSSTPGWLKSFPKWLISLCVPHVA